MKNIIFLVTLLFVYVTTNSICSRRKKWGFACDNNYEEVIYCVKNNIEWNAVTVENCNTDSYCDEASGQCVSSSEALSIQLKMELEGLYPDITDWTKYFECQFKKDAQDQLIFGCQQKTCPPRTFFNAETEKCAQDINEELCAFEPTCEKNGEYVSWPNSKTLFYLCVKTNNQFNAYLIRCPTGHIFKDGICVFETESNSGGEPGQPPRPPLSTQSPTGVPTWTTPFVPPIMARCPKQGLSPHSDCTKYYYCDSDLILQEHSCPDKYYYDRIFRRCLMGTC